MISVMKKEATTYDHQINTFHCQQTCMEYKEDNETLQDEYQYKLSVFLKQQFSNLSLLLLS